MDTRVEKTYSLMSEDVIYGKLSDRRHQLHRMMDDILERHRVAALAEIHPIVLELAEIELRYVPDHVVPLAIEHFGCL